MASVSLREVQVNDLPTLYENQRDREAVERAVVPSRDRAAFEAHWKKLMVDPTVLSRAIVVDGQLAGHVGAWDRDGERQVGYWLGRPFWGRGVATAALGQLLLLEPHRPLHAHVAKQNVASAKVLEKCGFVFQSSSLLEVEDLMLSPDQRQPVQFVDLLYRLDA